MQKKGQNRPKINISIFEAKQTVVDLSLATKFSINLKAIESRLKEIHFYWTKCLLKKLDSPKEGYVSICKKGSKYGQN